MRRRLVSLPQPRRLSSPPAFGSAGSPPAPRTPVGVTLAVSPWYGNPGDTVMWDGRPWGLQGWLPVPLCHQSARSDPSSAVPPCPQETTAPRPPPRHRLRSQPRDVLISRPGRRLCRHQSHNKSSSPFPAPSNIPPRLSPGQGAGVTVPRRHPRVGPHQSQCAATGTVPGTPGTAPRAASSGCHGSQEMLLILLGKLRHGERTNGDPEENAVPFATGMTPRGRPAFPDPLPNFPPESPAFCHQAGDTAKGRRAQAPGCN